MSNSPTTATDLFVGIDWADQKHDVCWLATDGRTRHFVLEHSPAELERLPARLQELAAGGAIRLAFEKSRGPLLYALMHRPELTLSGLLASCVWGVLRLGRLTSVAPDVCGS